MRVTIRQKDFEITPAFRVYVESKIVKPTFRLLGKVSGKALPILDLEFSRITRHHYKGKVYHAEANLALGGVLIRAEADGEEMRACCDMLEEGLERKIVKFKSRTQAREKRNARKVKRESRFNNAAKIIQKGRVFNEGN